MKTVTTLLFVVCFAALGVAPKLQAQTLELGLWTGTVAPPGGEDFDVTYLVESVNDTLKVTFNTPRGAIPFQDIKVDEGKLSFSWMAGDTLLKCNMKQEEEGQYKGQCVESDGETGQLTMVPPKPKEEGGQR